MGNRSSRTSGRGGRIERAGGGTLFLEDVHRLDLRAQTKLLQFLQTGDTDRIGATHPRSVDVRIVASSNADLGKAVSAGPFREDLYYRLAMFPITIAPLRERRSDLPALARHFLTAFARRYGKRIAGISDGGIGYLLTHDFPGNVAELESMIERAVIIAADGAILQHGCFPSGPEPGVSQLLGDLPETLGDGSVHRPLGELKPARGAFLAQETSRTEVVQLPDPGERGRRDPGQRSGGRIVRGDRPQDAG